MDQAKVDRLTQWIKDNAQSSESELREAALQGGSTEAEFQAAFSALEQQTAQLNYQGVNPRFKAFLIDSLIIGLLFFLFWLTLGTNQSGACSSSFYIGLTTTMNDQVSYTGLCGIPAWLFFISVTAYYIFFEWKYGATIGKHLTGIQVVKTTGARPDLSSIMIRNVLRLIDFLPFLYLLGAILIRFSRRKQRFGDQLAGTVVIQSPKA